MEQQQLSVEAADGIIAARLRGELTEQMLKECHKRVRHLVNEVRREKKILYDARELEPPNIDLVLMQQKMEAELHTLRLRRAIVVSDSRLAYLARIAFGEGDYRVFYNDLEAATQWLEE